MTDFVKTTNYGSKTTSDSILGAEFDVEFDTYATASATKLDKVSGASGDVVTVDANGDVEDSNYTLKGTRMKLLTSPVLLADETTFSTSSSTWDTVTASDAAAADAVMVMGRVLVSGSNGALPGGPYSVEVYVRKYNSELGADRVTLVASKRSPAGSSIGSISTADPFTALIDSSGRFEVKIVGNSWAGSATYSVYLDGYIY